MKKALWCAAHEMTQEQRESLMQEGFEVVLLKEVNPNLWKEITSLQIDSNRSAIALKLLSLARKEGYQIFQPAGDPCFHTTLGKYHYQASKLSGSMLDILFAYTQRVSEDIPQEDGTIKKVAIFRHEGWIS